MGSQIGNHRTSVRRENNASILFRESTMKQKQILRGRCHRLGNSAQLHEIRLPSTSANSLGSRVSHTLRPFEVLVRYDVVPLEAPSTVSQSECDNPITNTPTFSYQCQRPSRLKRDCRFAPTDGAVLASVYVVIWLCGHAEGANADSFSLVVTAAQMGKGWRAARVRLAVCVTLYRMK